MAGIGFEPTTFGLDNPAYWGSATTSASATPVVQDRLVLTVAAAGEVARISRAFDYQIEGRPKSPTERAAGLAYSTAGHFLVQ
jgi:hypothetical protein